MPSYNDLRPDSDESRKDYALVFPEMTGVEKKRTIENLLVLRAGLDATVATKKSDRNVLIASWNIKEFGHTTQRLPEAFFYTAEILDRFDLVVVQEVKTGLEDLYRLMKLLGDDWSYLVNDITEGNSGNSERGAYLYNNKRIHFAGLAGEIVLWDALTQNASIQQLKRTPYLTGFRTGWKSFSLVNLHLHPGDASDDIAYRREEVELLLAALETKTAAGTLWNKNIIAAGDFNFYEGASKDDPTLDLVRAAGFREVEGLRGVDTNASQTEVYDRLFLTSNDYFKVALDANGRENGGVFPIFDYVYKDGEEEIYKAYMLEQYTGNKDLEAPGKLTSYFKHPWRKNQMSDHFPIWFELITDSADSFLETKLAAY
ncbi:MAG: endonuclease/exonuclease/phosphatase family protein [Thermoanaerobaculia bacterium]